VDAEHNQRDELENLRATFEANVFAVVSLTTALLPAC
jgi:hypothetical protein